MSGYRPLPRFSIVANSRRLHADTQKLTIAAEALGAGVSEVARRHDMHILPV